MKNLEMREIFLEKLTGVLMKLPISHLPCVVVYQAWCLIDAKT